MLFFFLRRTTSDVTPQVTLEGWGVNFFDNSPKKRNFYLEELLSMFVMFIIIYCRICKHATHSVIATWYYKSDDREKFNILTTTLYRN